MAAAHQRGAGWVLARPLRTPRTGNQHTTPDKPTATKPSSPSMIVRRLPASSSFVLTAARLRALQLDPWPRGGKDRQLRGRTQKNSQPSPAARVVTGSDPYALLTLAALMGADVSVGCQAAEMLRVAGASLDRRRCGDYVTAQ
jgi:hypothetical protein